MNFSDLKLKSLNIDKKRFGRIFCFVDYGNVKYWYDKDERDWNGDDLAEDEKLIVDIEKLAAFVSSYSEQRRFYYGWNPRRKNNWHIVIKAERCGFIKNTKPLQFIKHYVGEVVMSRDGWRTKRNALEKYVDIPKGNFEVEISVDSIRLLKDYDTFCLFSGDSDFAYLTQFLKRNGKKSLSWLLVKYFIRLENWQIYVLMHRRSMVRLRP